MNLTELNEEQLKAVLDTEGAVMVTAGAGSGKTRLLTHRIAYLITEKHIDPYNILAITFTNKAAAEMRERLNAMLPNADKLWVSTFHSCCVRILRMYISHIGFTSNFSIYAEDEKERIIKALIKKKGREVDEYLKKTVYHISTAKNNANSADEYAEINKFDNEIDFICSIYKEYQEELRRNNALDFDDLLLVAYRLLTEVDEAREYFQKRFKYIHVDEFQDTNTIQYKFVKILASVHRNIFVVGDEDQCIYGWRGANIDNIINFRNDFNAKLYKLEQNYRSTKRVLNLANKLIINNTSRLDKNLWTENDEGAPIEYIVANSEGNEAENVVYRINKLVSEEGYNFSDIAILMRLNALSRSFEEKLIQYGIPFKVFGGFKFFERKEIKDILAYLKIVANPMDNEAIIRVINFPRRGIGDSTIAQLSNYAAINGLSLNNVVSNISSNPDLPLALIKKVVPFADFIAALNAKKDSLGLTDYVKFLVDMLHLDEVFDIDTDEGRDRLANVGEFISSVKSYSESNELATLNDYLQMITLYTDLDEMNADTSFVNLATVHSAKGLEFKAVFIVGVEDGIFPVSRANDSINDLEEERRLFYVAITRAREKLYISRGNTRFLYGQRKPAFASRFLKELELDVLREPRYGAVKKPQPTGTLITPTVMPTAVRQTGLDMDKVTVGCKVNHKKFGDGCIIELNKEHNGTYAVIEFAKVGKLTLALNFAPLTLVE